MYLIGRKLLNRKINDKYREKYKLNKSARININCFCRLDNCKKKFIEYIYL